MSKILNKTKPYELDVKRCYLPFSIITNCPNCGSTIERDVSTDYLSFPYLNSKECVGLYCTECENDFVIDIKISINVDILSEVKKM